MYKASLLILPPHSSLRRFVILILFPSYLWVVLVSFGRLLLRKSFFTLLDTTCLFVYWRKLRFHKKIQNYLFFSISFISPLLLLSHNWLNTVFLSFREEIVRIGFLCPIQKEFQRNGITTFIDNEIKREDLLVLSFYRWLEDLRSPDLRKQRGDFGKAFRKICVAKPEEVKQRCRRALTSAACCKCIFGLDLM